MSPRSLALVALVSLCAAARAEDAPPSAHFAKRPAVVGDAVEQTVASRSRLTLRTIREGRAVKAVERTSDRHQQRRVVATGLDGGRVVAARVHFTTSFETHDGQVAQQPIEGKSYDCRRDGERLVVLTADGAVPTLAEHAAVSRAMDSLGRENALADYLAGRTVEVGERLELPTDVARRALGLGAAIGDVERFTLTLRAVEPAGARFDAEVEATGAGSGQMRMLVGGPVTVDPATCRVVATELTGPVGLVESRGSLGNAYQVQGTGELRVAIEATYEDARRE